MDIWKIIYNLKTIKVMNIMLIVGDIVAENIQKMQPIPMLIPFREREREREREHFNTEEMV
ncbi:hypothetical protein D9V84_10230 [Bacteroidetes/Chlorobi group bacterium Naka2016]|nr:MAG: hypothetical protein D9V84_10230 [Bacteroidetes/Chlorobi group bacterium Naka2016]